MTWNRVRKLWNSRAKFWGAVATGFTGLAALIASIAFFVLTNWGAAVGSFIVAAELLYVSAAYLMTASEQPESNLCLTETEINSFMRSFISLGSRVHICSYNLSWVRGYPDMEQFLVEEAQKRDITVLVGAGDPVTERLAGAGLKIVEYPSSEPFTPRFTFLNLGRAGAQSLAVAREGLPTHWIDVYNVRRHPQVIEIAQAFIRRLEQVQ